MVPILDNRTLYKQVKKKINIKRKPRNTHMPCLRLTNVKHSIPILGTF